MKTQWKPHNINSHIQLLSFNATAAMPPWINWDINPSLELPVLMHKGLLTDIGFLHEVYPTLKMLLGTNILNLKWAASVATTFALIEAIAFLSANPKLRHGDHTPDYFSAPSTIPYLAGLTQQTELPDHVELSNKNE